MADLTYLTVVLVIGSLVLWATFRMEPHWSSKDGRRSICRGQRIDGHGREQGRWREYRAELQESGCLVARPRALSARGGWNEWLPESIAPAPGRRRKVVVVTRSTDRPDELLVLRYPASSPAVEAIRRTLDG